jgi:hypothetical protein
MDDSLAVSTRAGSKPAGSTAQFIKACNQYQRCCTQNRLAAAAER